MTRLKNILTSLLPGIFLIGYNVGTGSVTSMSKAGANFGLDLLWTILISCIITYYLINLVSRFTMVSGKTLIQGIKEDIHPSVAIILIIACSFIILIALTGLLGILADVLEVWSRTFISKGIPSIIWAVILAAFVFVLLWMGNYSFFEKVLAVLVSIMGVAFIATMIINLPSLKDLGAGMIPSLPETAEGSDNGPLMVISAMVGTTVSVFVFIIRSQIIQEKGWQINQQPMQRRDAFVSASMMFILSAAILITAATTLYVKGLKMNTVVEMIPLLEPIAGRAALGVFVIGIMAAGLSSHLPNLLVIPWLIIDYRKKERNTRTRFNRILFSSLSVFSVLGLVLGFKSVFVLLLSQTCIAIVLPLTIGSLFYLSTKKGLMGNHTNKISDIVILSLIMIFALYMSSLGVKGLIADLTNIIRI